MIDIRLKTSSGIKKGTFTDMKTKHVFWGDCHAPSNRELEELSKATKIAVHDLREYVDPKERPKLIDLEDYSVIVLAAPHKD